MANEIDKHIEYNKTVCGIDYCANSVLTKDGGKYKADIIVTTIPWNEFKTINGMPEEIRNSIKELRHTSVEIEYFPENLDTNAQWIYYPDKNLSYHRILVRHNFCSNSCGYWTETNYERIKSNTISKFKYINKYAYPLNTINKPIIMEKLLDWNKDHNVYGLGRWGEHCHYNSDVTVGLAVILAKKLIESA